MNKHTHTYGRPPHIEHTTTAIALQLSLSVVVPDGGAAVVGGQVDDADQVHQKGHEEELFVCFSRKKGVCVYMREVGIGESILMLYVRVATYPNAPPKKNKWHLL